MSSFRSMVQRNGRWWMMLGLQLGYPPCCIAAFVRGEQLAHDYEIPAEYHKTGFVPCRECAAVKPSIVIEYIQNHRHPKCGVFPNYEHIDNERKARTADKEHEGT